MLNTVGVIYLEILDKIAPCNDLVSGEGLGGHSPKLEYWPPKSVKIRADIGRMLCS